MAQMMKRPNFFIIGAPKCGTTAMVQWLSRHPEVFFCPRKEPHFFNSDGMTTTRSVAEYEALFEGALPSHLAVGEGSTHYFYSRTAVPNIVEYAPNARFIVCLRSPVEMAPALHGERLSHGLESVASFERAWHLQPARAAGCGIPRTAAGDPSRLLYGEYCKLGAQLERLYNVVAPERVLVIILDDVRKSPLDQYTKVLKFLGLHTEIQLNVDFAPVNPSKITKSASLAVMMRLVGNAKKRLGINRRFGIARTIRSFNVSEAKRDQLSSGLRTELQEYFADDVALLSKLINRDLSSWLT